jgi:3-oxoacyl-[acyl-carrier protein] reductase
MKNAIVTGASRGIGKAVAIQLAKENFHVIINYVSNEIEAQKTLDEIIGFDGSAELLKFDVSDKTQTEKAIENWTKNNPDKYISVLVNNAGIRKDGLILWMSDEDWFDVINTNLNSFFYLTRIIVKEMLVNKFGRIINIVSLSGLKGMPGQTNYSAAKAGIIGATKSLAQETARKGVTVNAVAPGFIKTDMTAELDEKELKKIIPAQRFGKPEEVAHLVSFLASENSAYITGETISINGGIY